MSLVILSGLLTGATAHAKEQVFKNNDQNKVQILELYTSEGCSSCPPADEWVSHLTGGKGVFRTFIPVVFHVEYWNYIGWKDIFSHASFSQRQRLYSREWGSRSIATPSFVLNGHLWKKWRQGKKARKYLNRRLKAEGHLEVKVQNFVNVTVRYQLPNQSGNRTVYLAQMSEGVISKITGGENQGRTLRHDFAVTNLTKVPLKKSGAGLYHAKMKLSSVPKALKGKKMSLAVWVSSSESQTPLQAVGGYLEP